MKTIRLSDINEFAAREIEAGRLTQDPEIRICTEWDGDERLAAKAVVETDDNGETYILLCQA